MSYEESKHLNLADSKYYTKAEILFFNKNLFPKNLEVKVSEI